MRRGIAIRRRTGPFKAWKHCVTPTSQFSICASLSKRERQVAELVLQGLRYKDVAVSLEISDHTVRNHLRNVFTKLHISSRVELAPYASETVAT
jgi:DNA-binding CsgD family transcriptional regulator